MPVDPSRAVPSRPILLCFDGSGDAASAIAAAAQVLSPAEAVVLTVWAPVAVWEPYDPATILSAPLSRLASNALGLDEIARELAEERVAQGAGIARRAGFEAQARVAQGKAWQTICRLAAELQASVIVLGARGLGRVEGMLLGSVSSAVVMHARRPVLVVPHEAGGGDPLV